MGKSNEIRNALDRVYNYLRDEKIDSRHIKHERKSFLCRK